MPLRATLPILLLLMAALAACAGVPVAQGTTTFILVRHAEKAADDPRDPSLTAAGEQRAARLAERLAGVPLSAVYSSDYRRTRQTAAPATARHGLDVTIYDAAQPAEAFATMLRDRHAGQTVLVVGHSNTLPALMSELCRCTPHVIDEGDYGDLFEIRLDAAGRYTLRHDRF